MITLLTSMCLGFFIENVGTGPNQTTDIGGAWANFSRTTSTISANKIKKKLHQIVKVPYCYNLQYIFGGKKVPIIIGQNILINHPLNSAVPLKFIFIVLKAFILSNQWLNQVNLYLNG